MKKVFSKILCHEENYCTNKKFQTDTLKNQFDNYVNENH